MVEGFVLDTTPQEETRQEMPMAKKEPEAHQSQHTIIMMTMSQ